MSSKRVPWKQQRTEAARKGLRGFPLNDALKWEDSQKPQPQEKQGHSRNARSRTSRFDTANEDY